MLCKPTCSDIIGKSHYVDEKSDLRKLSLIFFLSGLVMKIFSFIIIISISSLLLLACKSNEVNQLDTLLDSVLVNNHDKSNTPSVTGLLAAAFSPIGRTNMQWQTEVPLTNDPNNSFTSFGNARCIATNGDVIHVVWYDGPTTGAGNWNIFYKRSTDRGLTWSNNVNLSNNDSSIAYNPAIAVSGSYVHVVWYNKQDGNFEEQYTRSTDGGITWNSKIRLAYNTDISLHRSIAASGSNVHFVWFNNRDDKYDIYYKNSIDGGDTWSDDVQLTNTASAYYNPAVAISGSVVHVAWQDFTDGNWEIYYKCSTDGGINWGADTRLTNNSAISNFPTLAVSGSFVHLAWVDYRDGGCNIYYKHSINGGANWDSDTCLSDNNYQNIYPSLAVNGSDVHLTFQRLIATNYEIIYNISNNDGIKWGTDLQLTNNPSRSSVPSIAVSGSNVHVIFRDDRDGNSNIYYKRYIATSIAKIVAAAKREQEQGIPTVFQLRQNHPNPFNPTTTISYQIPIAGYVSLKVYDVAGREVVNLVNEFQQPGNFVKTLYGTSLPSGIYFCKMRVGNFTDTKKMILLK
jgi:hypothetical protein